MPTKRSRSRGAEPAAAGPLPPKDPGELRLVGDVQRESSPPAAGQSYGGDTLSDGEKAFIDFLIDKAIEAWRRR